MELWQSGASGNPKAERKDPGTSKDGPGLVNDPNIIASMQLNHLSGYRDVVKGHRLHFDGKTMRLQSDELTVKISRIGLQALSAFKSMLTEFKDK